MEIFFLDVRILKNCTCLMLDQIHEKNFASEKFHDGFMSSFFSRSGKSLIREATIRAILMAARKASKWQLSCKNSLSFNFF